MAVTIETLLLRVAGETSGLNAIPTAVNNVVSRVRSSLAKAGSAPGADQMAGRFVDATGRMREANGRFVQGLGQTQTAIGGVKGAMGSLAGAGFSAVLAGLGLASVNAAVKLDSLKRGLGSVATEADPVSAQLERLREVAKLPGLGFPEAIEGSTRLQAAGLSAGLAEGALMGFGNALASVGAGKDELSGVIRALSQIQAKGAVMAEEINQIAERLPQIRPLMQAAFGTSNTEALQKMGLGSEEFISKLVDQLGTLERVSSGPGVALENIQDGLFVLAAAVGDAVLPAIAAFSDAIVPALTAATEGFAALPGPVKTALAGVVAILAVAGPLALVFSVVSGAALATAAALVPVGLALGVLVDAWTAVQDALSGDPDRMNKAVESYGSALPGLIEMFETVRDIAMTVWEEVSGVISDALATLEPVIDDAITIALGLWAYFGDEIMTVVTFAWGVVENVIGAAVDVIAGAFRIVAALVQGDWAGAWDAFLGVVKSVAVRFTALLARMTAAIFGLFQNMARLVPFIGDSIANGLASAQQSLNGFADVLEWDGTPLDIPVTPVAESSPTLPDSGPSSFTRTPRTTKPKRTPLTDEQKRAEKVRDILDDLPRQLAAAEAQSALFGDALSAAEDKARLIETAIRGLIENGLTVADGRVQALATQFRNATSEAKALQRAADLEDVLGTALTDMTALETAAATFGESWSIPEERVQIYRDAISGLQAIDPGDERIAGLVRLWRLATDEAEQHKRIVAQGEAFDAQEESALAALSAYIAATDAAETFLNAIGDRAAYASARVQALRQYLADLVSQGEGANSQDVLDTVALLRTAEQAETAANAVVSAFESMKSAAVAFGVEALTALGNAALGSEDLGGALLGAVGNLVGGVFDALGNMMITTGLAAISLGGTIAAILQALSTLNPFVAIGAGIALVAAGAVVKNALAGAASGRSSSSGGSRGGFAVGGSYGGSGRSAAFGERGVSDANRAVISELQGLRSDVQGLADRPVNFTGDPREFRRAQAAAAADARRTDVRTTSPAPAGY